MPMLAVPKMVPAASEASMISGSAARPLALVSVMAMPILPVDLATDDGVGRLACGRAGGRG